jgi:hypothetical protein
MRYDGVQWGDIDKWGDGLVTRGVLLDVPRYRGVEFVDMDSPVHGDELASVARQQGVVIEPGDAVVIYSGREAWTRAKGLWGSDTQADACCSAEDSASAESASPLSSLQRNARPGLHASCLKFLRETDCAMLVWDMMDATPIGYEELAWAVHAAIWAYGLALVDNALLEPLAFACRELDTSEFMLMVAPLRVEGGTGSPVNPIAIL